MKKKIYVHIADDHKIVIEGIIAVINMDDDIAIKGYSLTGQEVIDSFEFKSYRADVLILDITMPEVDGFDVLRFFRNKKIIQKVIILSSYDDIKIVEEVFRLGCNGYITKNNAGKHIVEAIKTVYNGQQYLSDDIKKMMLKSFSGGKLDETSAPDKILTELLTERELEIIRLIIREYNSQEIAEVLKVSTRTVETHRKNLIKKLKVKNSVGLAVYAVKNKIV